MRYTEARLQPLADDMQADLDKETVDFTPNYDETTEEPTVLPTPFPNLLVNGAAGIAVGMATNIPPHNLGEVVDAVTALIDDPQLDAELAFLGVGLQARCALDVAAAVGGVARAERLGVAAAGLLRRAIAAEDAAVGHEVAPEG